MRRAWCRSRAKIHCGAVEKVDSPFVSLAVIFQRARLECSRFDRYHRGMTENGHRRWIRWLVLGDCLAFLALTFFGFARHETLQASAWKRMLATFVPFFTAWLVIAPWLDLYQPRIVGEIRSLWRLPLAAIITAPLGGLLRAIWLQSVVIPVFVLVMSAVTAVLMLLWRGAVALLLRRRALSSVGVE